MPDSFTFRVPVINGEPLMHTINVGEILYVLGANGEVVPVVRTVRQQG